MLYVQLLVKHEIEKYTKEVSKNPQMPPQFKLMKYFQYYIV